MKIKLYEGWGVLAHEKQPVYTVNCPVSDAYNLVEVELPHVTGANYYGELLITLDGTQYLLHEAHQLGRQARACLVRRPEHAPYHAGRYKDRRLNHVARPWAWYAGKGCTK